MASTHDELATDMLPPLMAVHPLLFANREFLIPSSLAGGWYAIADRMFTDLEALLGPVAAQWQPIQSKEKFGSWRLYWRLDLAEDADKPEPFNVDVATLGDSAAPIEAIDD